MDPTLTVVLVSLAFSAMFSGVEIAFISSNKLHLEIEGQKGSLTGRIISNFSKNPSNFIGAILIGNTLSLVVYGIYMTNLLEPWMVSQLPDILNNQGSLLIIQTLVTTIIVLVMSEFLPKSLFMLDPNRVLKLFAVPMQLIYYILYPIVWITVGLSKFILTNILRLKYNEETPVYGLTDLNDFIKSLQSKGNPGNVDIDVDTKILDNVLDFRDAKIRDCMIPRTEIVAVDIEDKIAEIRDIFVESGHSKLLVYRDSIDNIVGYIHSMELFKKPRNIESIMTPILIVTETMLANELMIKFISEHRSLALVVDEFGGTSGIVTMEDIIEEIFGEIKDEHDSEELIENKISNNIYMLSARHEIDYLNDKYNWNLPEGEYETVGGLVLSVTEDLPKKDDLVVVGNFEFQILSMEDKRIETVKLRIKNLEN